MNGNITVYDSIKFLMEKEYYFIRLEHDNTGITVVQKKQVTFRVSYYSLYSPRHFLYINLHRHIISLHHVQGTYTGCCILRQET